MPMYMAQGSQVASSATVASRRMLVSFSRDIIHDIFSLGSQVGNPGLFPCFGYCQLSTQQHKVDQFAGGFGRLGEIGVQESNGWGPWNLVVCYFLDQGKHPVPE